MIRAHPLNLPFPSQVQFAVLVKNRSFGSLFPHFQTDIILFQIKNGYQQNEPYATTSFAKYWVMLIVQFMSIRSLLICTHWKCFDRLYCGLATPESSLLPRFWQTLLWTCYTRIFSPPSFLYPKWSLQLLPRETVSFRESGVERRVAALSLPSLVIGGGRISHAEYSDADGP